MTTRPVIRGGPMQPHRGSVVREFMLWLFDVPFGEPYISATVDIRWENALAWLERENRGGAPRITSHHLFTAAVGRLFKEMPALNARIFGQTIYPLPSVDVVMPVHLDGGDVDRELSMVIVRDVDTLDPRGVAAAIAPKVKSERAGTPADPIVDLLLNAGKRSPAALRMALRGIALAAHDPRGAALLNKQFPVSTLITNVGAALASTPGVRFRSVAFSPPSKLIHIGSVFGLGPIERTPVVDGDRVVPGTVLPVAFIFDHRLADGVLGGRLLARLAGILQDPDAVWREKH